MFNTILCSAGEQAFNLNIFLYLGVILFSTKFLGIFCRRLGLPQVIGALIAGLLIGPVVLNIVPKNNTVLDAMGQIGVLLLMFSAGLDTNLKEIKKNGLPSMVITLLGVFVPLGLGFLVGWSSVGFGAFKNQDELLHALFFGVLMTATSVGITVEVLKELGKLKGKVGSSILSAAILDDIIGVVILSIVISIKEGGKGDGNNTLGNLITPTEPIIATIVNVILFFVFAVIAGILIHYMFKWLFKKFPVTRRLPIFGLVICFLFSWISEEYFAIASITGAFLAGMVMSNMSATPYVEKKIDINLYMLFSPIFFATIGINMDFSTFTMEIFGFSILFAVVGLASKIIGCGFGAKVCGYTWKDSVRVGFGMMARGEVVLIMATKGMSSGLIGSEYMAAVVMLIIISSFFTPIALKLLYRREQATPIMMEGIEPPEYLDKSTNYMD